MKLRHLTLFALLTATPLWAKQASNVLNLQQRSYRYLCDNKKNVTVHYITTEDRKKKSSVSFLYIDLDNQSYGLTEAVSASGARYVGHHGTDLSHGLVWWEKGNSASLYSFAGDDAQNTHVIYQDCRLLKRH
ncbi:MAG: MliC family protein [Zymomonas mobilis]|uniref:Membrane-bound inhibitor of C-type lysozyme n=1 Tax=Zymomonas mobilis TaxID=542 RepID=A0A542W169_ZYMMB|nr:MliC family protein [Zymomonas mobilis]TQL17335.1 membrane-bound inhibitor of C-type lysozyme [Zymomonas mobilis]